MSGTARVDDEEIRAAAIVAYSLGARTKLACQPRDSPLTGDDVAAGPAKCADRDLVRGTGETESYLL